MSAIKCNKCGKVIIDLMPGSSLATGTVVTCASCYKRHIRKHKAQEENVKLAVRKKTK